MLESPLITKALPARWHSMQRRCPGLLRALQSRPERLRIRIRHEMTREATEALGFRSLSLLRPGRKISGPAASRLYERLDPCVSL